MQFIKNIKLKREQEKYVRKLVDHIENHLIDGDIPSKRLEVDQLELPKGSGKRVILGKVIEESLYRATESFSQKICFLFIAPQERIFRCENRVKESGSNIRSSLVLQSNTDFQLKFLEVAFISREELMEDNGLLSDSGLNSNTSRRESLINQIKQEQERGVKFFAITYGLTNELNDKIHNLLNGEVKIHYFIDSTNL